MGWKLVRPMRFRGPKVDDAFDRGDEVEEIDLNDKSTLTEEEYQAWISFRNKKAKDDPNGRYLPCRLGGKPRWLKIDADIKSDEPEVVQREPAKPYRSGRTPPR